ncbi:MAG: flagellar type III secretion system protein FliR [Gemmatimonadetes bacterium]|nr:flagellar type III secretion system protein FliR [Gemmatimonadota bacterium]MBT4612271.1 flagellar type III secretion system protein FliR [Gemmatimonadota bacterium]MBT5058661.1 flagellar type III secretion system protein FliR [Gemmatimonadota bacterium]MBT5144098.1 flagellar type III secretion system protein FliR [Gemmatimonadota bacterium]MBT5586570.1 flagellar type III secretion system protein FliR [Gemmatimonadota bacterium]
MEYWLEQFHVFLLVLLRVSALLMVAPIFGHRTWMARAKVGLAFTVSIILFPLVAESTPEIPVGVLPYALMMIKEVLMGVVMGFVVLLLFVGIQFAGQLAGLQMGFGIVNVIDPQSSNQVSIMGQFLNVLAILLLLSLNGHHTILTGLVTSFETIPLGGVELKVGLMYKMITLTTQVFVIAVQISAPIMTALFLVTAALGVLARTVPQMNVFMVGFPVQITVGLGAFLVCLPFFGMLVERLIIVMRRDLLVMVDLMH